MTTDLKKLAEAATQGEWKCLANYYGKPSVHCNETGHIAMLSYRAYPSNFSPKPRTREQAISDAEYIAAANPKKILELLQEVETLREALGHEANAYIGCAAERDALKRVLAFARQEALEEAAKVCETGCVQIGCTALEAEGIVRRTRGALASGIRALQHTGEDGETKP